MSDSEMTAVLAMLGRGQDSEAGDLPIWQQRHNMDMLGLQLSMPSEPVDITHIRAGGVPGLKFSPAATIGDNTLLYLHGGGYMMGSAASHRHLVAKLAIDASLTAWSLDYRMAPEWAYPAALDDALTAYRHLLNEGIPAREIIVAGDSAGGGLAASLMIALKREELPQPAGAVLISPWTDLTQSGESYETRSAVDPLVTKQTLDTLSRLYLRGADPKADTASPLFADLTGLAPIYIQVGDAEVMLSDSTAFAEKAREAGVDVQIDVYLEMIHIFPYFWPLLTAGRDACDRIAAFCREKLG